jgi:hypothetical protein
VCSGDVIPRIIEDVFESPWLLGQRRALWFQAVRWKRDALATASQHQAAAKCHGLPVPIVYTTHSTSVTGIEAAELLSGLWSRIAGNSIFDH